MVGELKRIDKQLKNLAEQIRDLTGIDREMYIVKVDMWLDARNRVTKH